jgi:hypothetical protein
MKLKELIDEDSFWQYFPLDANDFIEYCKERGIRINEEYLESLEKDGILKPIMRTREYHVCNISDLKELYKDELVFDPLEVKFTPWEEFYRYNAQYEYWQKTIYTYYHPYQIILLNKILFYKKISANTSLIKTELDKQDKFVRLLLFVQNKYLPIITGYTYVDPLLDYDDIEENIKPKEMVKRLNITIEEIKNFRRNVAVDGDSFDPLSNWYAIVKYIKFDKRKKLKGKALFAQDYYIISDMLGYLLEDLTGEEQIETGSLSDTMKGEGKKRIYGKKLNYKDRDVLSKLLYDYGINPKPKTMLLVEGDTEEISLPIIFEAMNFDVHKYGVQIINLNGVDKQIREMLVQYLVPDIFNGHVYPFRTKIFIIADNEGRGYMKRLANDQNYEIDSIVESVFKLIRKKIKPNSEDIIKDFLKKGIKIDRWKNNFEYDNFPNDEELSIEINKHYNNTTNITKYDVEKLRNGKGDLKKFIEKKTGKKFYKSTFGVQLSKKIAEEIKCGNYNREVFEKLNNIIMFTLSE